MQTANIMLALGGDKGTTVPKYRVTASEIAVLRVIHGADAVTEVEPTEDIERAHREEITRLARTYGRARTTDMNGNDVSVVASLFPGAAARTFRTLEELEIPEEFFKAASRVAPKAAKAEQGAEKDIDDMTKGELVDFAEAHEIDVDTSAKKAEVLAAIKAAMTVEPEGENEVPAGNEEALFG